MDPNQLRSIINDICEILHAQSDDATELLLMTGAHESRLGKYVYQLTGPAAGLLQQEPIDYNDLWNNYLPRKTDLRTRVFKAIGYDTIPAHPRLATDMALAITMGRVHYLRCPAPIPPKSNTKAMSQYCKTYWNTVDGKATPSDYEKAYNELVLRKA